MKNHDIERRLGENLLTEKISFFRSNKLVTYHEHWHDFYEWIFYYNCEAVGCLNGSVYEIHDRTSVLLTPYDFHSTKVTQKNDPSFFIRVSFKKNELPITIPETGYYLKETDLFFDYLLSAMEVADISEREYLLVAMLTRMKKVGVPLVDNRKEIKADIIRVALRYMCNNFATANLTNTAEICGVSRGYLSTLFTKYCNSTFTNALSEIRMNYAKTAIRSTDKKLTEVAFDSGYNDFSNFLRYFKKCCGVTPTEYRKMYLDESSDM